MSGEAAATSRAWRVGQHTCTLTIPKPRRGETAIAVVEWEPSRPPRLTAAEFAEYRSGRNAALAELGVRTLVVDL